MRCPACKQYVPDGLGLKICPSCNADITNVVADRKTPPPESNSKEVDLKTSIDSSAKKEPAKLNKQFNWSWLGLSFVLIHSVITILINLGEYQYARSNANGGWMIMMLLIADFPMSLLAMAVAPLTTLLFSALGLSFGNSIQNDIVGAGLAFLVIGGFQWYFIGWIITKCFIFLDKKSKKIPIIISLIILCIVSGSVFLRKTKFFEKQKEQKITKTLLAEGEVVEVPIEYYSEVKYKKGDKSFKRIKIYFDRNERPWFLEETWLDSTPRLKKGDKIKIYRKMIKVDSKGHMAPYAISPYSIDFKKKDE